ncbi:hypothetical protein FS837_002517 [Tulasnella sp. UAMH 9824]|nr:hypothetical protein FS837_002517 [Tulasnella sp. UAMH 9824]
MSPLSPLKVTYVAFPTITNFDTTSTACLQKPESWAPLALAPSSPSARTTNFLVRALGDLLSSFRTQENPYLAVPNSVLQIKPSIHRLESCSTPLPTLGSPEHRVDESSQLQHASKSNSETASWDIRNRERSCRTTSGGCPQRVQSGKTEDLRPSRSSPSPSTNQRSQPL